jgi:Phosphomethylpyrimidine kinase
MTVISIQSQVVHGHVGNSAAVFPLQVCGIEVAAVPTALLSNHPHYSSMRGGVLDAKFVRDLLVGVEERGRVDTCKVLISGYLGSPTIAAAVIDFVRRAKARNPNLLYLCDPVMGDADLGFYVDEDMRALFCEGLVPLADIITPNQFELEHLVGRACDGRRHYRGRARAWAIDGCNNRRAAPRRVFRDRSDLGNRAPGRLDDLDSQAFLPSPGDRRSLHRAFRRRAGAGPHNRSGTRPRRLRRLRRSRGNGAAAVL